jgi:hypothetical protein
VQHKTSDDLTDHELAWVAEVEYTTDYEPFGSTYVPRESAEMLEGHWEWDGEEKAEWWINSRLLMMGYKIEEVGQLKTRATENWKAEEAF